VGKKSKKTILIHNLKLVLAKRKEENEIYEGYVRACFYERNWKKEKKEGILLCNGAKKSKIYKGLSHL